MTRPLVDHTYGSLLDAFAAPTPTPGGGSVAALTAAAAAALVERCALASGARFRAARARASALRLELVALADEDVLAVDALAKAARREPGSLAAAAAGASVAPGLLRDAAEELARLAAALERDGLPLLRGEACCARVLAEAASRVAESIVALNHGLIDETV